jgi:drug/metabolite transporter (DMT)-like permease
VPSIVAALASSLAWGVSDFLGGLTSRRLGVLVVLLASQSVGALFLVPLASLHTAPAIDIVGLGSAAAASGAGLVGIAGLYRGMAVGSISIVAPISATGAVIPILFGIARGEQVSAVQSAGVLLALVGVVLASRAPDPESRGGGPKVARGVGYALVAALGFGGFFVLLHEASVASDVLWAAAIQRVSGVCITLAIVLVRRTSLRISPRRLPMLCLIGILDSSANVLYGYASVSGLVSLAAMLSSLFPVVTVLLARILLRERMSRSQGSGVLLALAGVACIAAQ